MFPCESVEVHVTMVVPIGKVEPEGGVHITGTDPSTRSVAVGVVYVTTMPILCLTWTIISAGVPVIVGGVVSVTVTDCVAVALFP